MRLETFLGTSFSMGCVALALWLGQREALRRRERERVIVLDVDPELPVATDHPDTYDAAAGDAWIAHARTVALGLAETGDVTTDDLWRVCPPPENVDGRKVAGVFSRSEWEIVGYRKSDRARNSAREIAVWRRKTAMKEAAE